MSNKKRYAPDVRKQQIVEAGVALAERDGLSAITRDGVAREVGISGAAVQYHFGTVKQLQRAVKRAAVAAQSMRVIAQLIAAGDPAVEGLDAEVRAAAIEGLRL